MGDYDLDTEKIKKSMESGMRTLENGFQKLSNDVKNEEGVFGKLFSKSISLLQEGNAKYEDAYYEAMIRFQKNRLCESIKRKRIA